MADDDLIEEFNITESDLDSAFNPTRRRGRQSREESIYGKNLFLIRQDILYAYLTGIWATAAERASTRPTTTSSYGRVSQPISFVSGGVKMGSKIEKKKAESKSKKAPIIESYDSDEDSDVKLDDDDDDDVEFIGKKRKRRGDFQDEDEDDDDEDNSDVEEIEDESNRRAGSVRE